MKFDEKMSKAELLRRAQALSTKFEAIERRRVAQIDRLIGHLDHDGKVNPKIPPYEHELMELNETIARQDIRLEMLEGVLRRIRQSCRDKSSAWVTGHVASGKPTIDMLDRFVEMIEEVMPDERPGHLAEGRDTSDVAIVAAEIERLGRIGGGDENLLR